MRVSAAPGMSARMLTEPFLTTSGAQFLPTPMARGFWGPADNLHARVLIGLAARELERAHGGPGVQPARLTIDLFRMPDLSPLEVGVSVVRSSGRLTVADAEIRSGGKPCARATCQFLKQTEQPHGAVWRGPSWDAPPPETLPAFEPVPLEGRWEVRPALGGFHEAGPKRVWLREVRPLVDAEAYTPFVRVATGVDFISPLSHAGDRGLGFINTDATLYLHRAMRGQWVGYEVSNHQSEAGVAIGHCTLHDEEGPIGFASCAALAQRRPPSG